ERQPGGLDAHGRGSLVVGRHAARALAPAAADGAGNGAAVEPRPGDVGGGTDDASHVFLPVTVWWRMRAVVSTKSPRVTPRGSRSKWYDAIRSSMETIAAAAEYGVISGGTRPASWFSATAAAMRSVTRPSVRLRTSRNR